MRRAPIITTARGTRSEAFGTIEWALLAGIAGMWGSSFLLIAIGLEAFRPGLVALLRIAFGAAALSLFQGARGRVEREDLPRLALLGVVWSAVPLTLFAVAQQWIDSSRAGMINGAMPLFTALFATLLLRRAPGLVQTVGLAVGFGGVVLVTLPAAAGASSTTAGVLLALLATVCYGVAANVAVPLHQRYGALPVVWRAQILALVLVAPYGLASVPGSALTASSLSAMIVLGLGSTGLAFVLMVVLVGRAGATRGAVANYFVPIVAAVLGVVLRDETIGPAGIAGVALILLGAYLTSRREA